MATTEVTCRSCGTGPLHEILSLGDSPLADRLLTPEQCHEPEPTAPLDVVLCSACSLMQLTHSVPPEELFCRDYPYYSSVSPTLLAHFQASAEAIIEDRRLDANSLVVELASNDGYMLRHFHRAGIPVLGIDPADGPARAAQGAGIPTRTTFFTQGLAKSLRDEEGLRADIILANNVLAHVPDLNGFVAGIRTLLKPDGQAVIEVPYAVDLVDKLEFDTIYHQHLCYFTVTALDQLFRRHGLYLNHVDRTEIHGGSLRLFVEHTERPDTSVTDLLRWERTRGITTLAYFTDFAARTENLRRQLMTLLDGIKAEGRRIVGYGAAAKATTLMNFCGIDGRHLDYIVDLSPHKQGLYTGGNHLPIRKPDCLVTDRPDYTLILAWNFADEIIAQQRQYLDVGGQFIVPLPEPRLVNAPAIA
ncbi:Methyltransferase domain-containing protein [Limimonas halophila]|uniref:Methyltransferase domain-containing protein n=1 Tax=Limimonas halophila TaxID=1082479 RepID=A0A1G7NR93_9PROT|nr:class I SAM-dependent methyltransferase [Limimonas halophila]SDF76481.1 Methyltransferase domain-containing protein [Limimonas halophila]